jgi:hypothetical protein
MATYMLSEHFSLQEFIYSQNASRAGIKNTPTLEAFMHLNKLAATMELVRGLLLSNPVTITSGYRNEETNKLCGGSTTSAHMSGFAADFIVPGFGDPIDICKAIEPYVARLKIDQLILEYGDWVHLAICERAAVPRGECLTITNAGTSSGF